MQSQQQKDISLPLVTAKGIEKIVVVPPLQIQWYDCLDTIPQTMPQERVDSDDKDEPNNSLMKTRTLEGHALSSADHTDRDAISTLLHDLNFFIHSMCGSKLSKARQHQKSIFEKQPMLEDDKVQSKLMARFMRCRW